MIRRTLLLARLETVLFLREPAAVFFALAFPVLMLVFVGGVQGRGAQGGRFIDGYFPMVVAVSAANLGVLGLTLHLAENRARGVLRRFRLSPLGPLEFFAGHVLTSVVLLAVSLGGPAAVTLALYGPAPRGRPVVFLGVLALTAYTMFSLGVFVGGLPISLRGNQVLGSVLFFVMFISSGAAIRRDLFPRWLAALSELNPLSHLADALTAGYTGRRGVPVLPLVAVCAGTVVLNLVTSRTFDWEGRS
jgi:ABC-2 type transport system permease protein